MPAKHPPGRSGRSQPVRSGGCGWYCRRPNVRSEQCQVVTAGVGDDRPGLGGQVVQAVGAGCDGWGRLRPTRCGTELLEGVPTSSSSPPTSLAARCRDAGRSIHGTGFDYLHSAVDDHSRLAYTEIHGDEKVATCATFLTRAAAFFTDVGITRIERVLTDNAWAYRRGLPGRLPWPISV